MRFSLVVRQLLLLILALTWPLSTLALAPLARATAVPSATVPPGFTDTLVANISEAAGGGTALAFTPDNRMLVTTQAGQVLLHDSNGLAISTALDFRTQWPARRICSDLERGLLGIATDPNFVFNKYIYLYYTAVVAPAAFTDCDGGEGRNSPNVVNRVSRFTLVGTTIPTTTEQILVDNIRSLGAAHNGGDLNFGKDGLLYISTGDGGSGGDLSQARDTLNGKILRVNSDGTAAAGNPWFAEAGSRRCGQPGPQNYPASGNCQEILSYGLRNPFRFAMDPTTSGDAVRFFINDVGQDVWEEVNVGQVGANYGWNVREGPCESYDPCEPSTPIDSGYADPIDWYNHSTGCYAITGAAFVPANVWPGYDGSYLYADSGCGRVFQLVPDGTGGYVRASADFATNIDDENHNGVRHFEFGPYQGTQALYYVTGTTLRRIALDNGKPAAVIAASPSYGAAPLIVNLSAAGSRDPNGDALSYEWSFGDTQTATSTSPTIAHTYQNAGAYTATLVVRDNGGLASDPVSRQIQPGNTPPAAVISQPGNGLTFAVGDRISLAGSATDAEPTTRPVTLRWDVLLWHIDASNPGNAHVHTLSTINSGAGQFTAPAPEGFTASALSYVELRLTATDGWGLSSVVSQTLQPRRVNVTLVTQPSGLQITANGYKATGGQTLTAWENWVLELSAPVVQAQGANAWVFTEWEDKSTSATRSVIMAATSKTYTATFIAGQRLFVPMLRR